MTSENDDLTAGEGVNDSSADSAGEPTEATGVAGALAAASSTGRPAGEYDPAPPVDTDLPQTRTDDDGRVGPGQELDVDT